MERDRRKRPEQGRPEQLISEELRRRKEEEQAKIYNQEEWQTNNGRRSRRKGLMNHKDWREKLPTTSVFVSNLPENISEASLYRKFSSYGDLVSVYVAKKRDCQKNIFGFLRFVKVSDEDSLVDSMSHVTFEGVKVEVNIAK
ncbi:ribosome biogenesis protein 15-like [Helianthus annuus]|uniref:ribosome biogenesis protein 15-like n=1 Tax=Helianthus annuus TaxID=4232 RepID=UPI000B907C3E|nr:ribosome biogenesis protein 15-like [Helianthus annuus]